MLFHVRMNVDLPASLDPEESATLRQAEKDLAQRLQREGKWRHLWRIAGQYANVSIFDVDSVEELHALLTALPLFPYMQIDVMPLCRHPSSIRTDDR
jgi:muconolactone D-isomerase